MRDYLYRITVEGMSRAIASVMLFPFTYLIVLASVRMGAWEWADVPEPNGRQILLLAFGIMLFCR